MTVAFSQAEIDGLTKQLSEISDMTAFTRLLNASADTDELLENAGIETATLTADQLFMPIATSPYLQSLTPAELVEKVAEGNTNQVLSTQTSDFSLTYYDEHPLVVVPYSGDVELQDITGWPSAFAGFLILATPAANGSLLTFDMTAFQDSAGIGLNPPTTVGSFVLYGVVNLGVESVPLNGIQKIWEYVA